MQVVVLFLGVLRAFAMSSNLALTALVFVVVGTADGCHCQDTVCLIVRVVLPVSLLPGR